jgi:hypothetical protein
MTAMIILQYLDDAVNTNKTVYEQLRRLTF